jgi:hypothetical protein
MTKSTKYPGVLGQRSNDVVPLQPPDTVLGEPSAQSKREYEEVKRQWVQRQVLREFDGIVRLLEHYQIEDSDDRFFHLALALARDHVPYCMVPAQGRGRKKTTQTFLPLIDGLAKAAKGAGQPQSVVYEQFAEVLNIEKESVIREVKRFRSENKGGKKKK